MTRYARMVSGQPQFITAEFSTGEGADEVRHPLPWLDDSTTEELAVFGIGPVQEVDPAPEGQRIASETLMHGEGGFYVVAVYEDIVPPVPRIMDRLRWLRAVKQIGDDLEVDSMAIVFGAVDALGVNDPVYLYFHNAPYLNRDDTEYDAIETILSADEAATDAVFALANSLPRPAGI